MAGVRTELAEAITIPGASASALGLAALYDDVIFKALYATVQDARRSLPAWDNLAHVEAFAAGAEQAGDLLARFTAPQQRRALAHLLWQLLPASSRARAHLPLPDEIARRADDHFTLVPGDVPRVAASWVAFLADPALLDKALARSPLVLVPRSQAKAPQQNAPAALVQVERVEGGMVHAHRANHIDDPARPTAVDTVAAWLLSAGPDARGLDLADRKFYRGKRSSPTASLLGRASRREIPLGPQKLRRTRAISSTHSARTSPSPPGRRVGGSPVERQLRRVAGLGERKRHRWEVEVLEDRLDRARLLDEGQDLDPALAAGALENVDAPHAFEGRGPVEGLARRVRFGLSVSRPVGGRLRRRAGGNLRGRLWDHEGAQLVVGRENSREAKEMVAGRRNQWGELSEQLHAGHDQVRASIGEGAFHLIGDAPVR